MPSYTAYPHPQVLQFLDTMPAAAAEAVEPAAALAQELLHWVHEVAAEVAAGAEAVPAAAEAAAAVLLALQAQAAASSLPVLVGEEEAKELHQLTEQPAAAGNPGCPQHLS